MLHCSIHKHEGIIVSHDTNISFHYTTAHELYNVTSTSQQSIGIQKTFVQI